MRKLSLIALLAAPALAQDCEPEFLMTLDTISQDVATTGQIGVISKFETGIQIVDISTPAEPRVLSDFQTVNGAICIAASGDTIFVGAYNPFYPMPFLQTIDVRNPAKPVSLAEIALDKIVFGIDVQGDLLFLSLLGDDFDEVRIYDVHDPSNPTVLAQIQTPRHAGDSDMADGLLYFVSSSILFIYDVTEPTTPTLVGQTTACLGALNVEYSDGFVYLASGRFGLLIVDVRDPSNPQLISTIDLPGEVADVTIKGTTAYASYTANARGVAAVDISDPFNPIIRGTVDLPSATHSIALADNNTLLVSTISSVTHFVDITPCEPCPADLDGDANLDADDFFFYLDAFANGDLIICDIDQDADCDGEDFFAYLDLFATGC